MSGFFRRVLDGIAEPLGFHRAPDRTAAAAPLTLAQYDASEERLAAVFAAPLDDAPRLVYADWLETLGRPASDAQATFLRASCEHVRRWHAEGLLSDTSDLDRLADDWAPIWNEQFPLNSVHLPRQWRRGFPEAVTASYVPEPATIAGACWPALVSLSAHIASEFDRRQLAALLRSPVLNHLAELCLSGSGVNDFSAMQIGAAARFGRLAHLRFLGLQSGNVRDEGIVALVNAAFFPQLEVLWLNGCQLNQRTAAKLLESSTGASLTALSLSANFLTDDTLAALVASPLAANLRSLELYSNRFTLDGIRTLAAWPGLARLNVLNLADCGLTDDCAFALAASPYLTSSTRLDLSLNPIGPRGEALLYRFVGASRPEGIL